MLFRSRHSQVWLYLLLGGRVQMGLWLRQLVVGLCHLVSQSFNHPRLPARPPCAEGGQHVVLQQNGYLLFSAAACGPSAPLTCAGDARQHRVLAQRPLVFVLAGPNKVTARNWNLTQAYVALKTIDVIAI